jgi:peroxiredoxin family protein
MGQAVSDREGQDPPVPRKGLGIILHSGSYDHVHHGLSVALTALALDREVRLLFTYWALGYVRKDRREVRDSDRDLVERMDKRNMGRVADFLSQSKKLGAKIYACSSSMALLNMTRKDLIDEVDDVTGVASFMMETEDGQLLFV